MRQKLIPLALGTILLSLASCGGATSSSASSVASSISNPTSISSTESSEPSSESSNSSLPSSESSSEAVSISSEDSSELSSEPVKDPATMELVMAQQFIFVGDDLPLSVSVEGATSDAVSWRIEDDTVASISENGVLTGLTAGTTFVTATLVEDPTVFKTVSIQVKASPADFVIEDAEDKTTTEVQDEWSISYYNNDWVPFSAAYVVVDSDAAYGTGGTRCLKFRHSNQGVPFRFQKGISVDAGYSSVSLDYKGQTGQRVRIQFVDEDGNWASSDEVSITDNWGNFSLAIANMKINGTSTTVAEYAASMGCLPNYIISRFNKINILITGGSDYTDAYTYIDNLTLSAEKEGHDSVDSFKSVKKYTALAADGNTVIVFEPGEESTPAKVYTINLETNLSVTGNVAYDGANVSFKSSDDGATLSFEAKRSAYGDVMSNLAATGSLASYLNGLTFNSVQTINDFESYTSSGVGYSAQHDETEREGLCGDFYMDFWSSDAHSVSSEVGGPNWYMTEDENPMELLTDGQGHSGQYASMKSLKSANARYLTWGGYTAKERSLGSGDTLSVWLKNTSSADMSVVLKAYYASQVTPSNQGDTGVYATNEVVVPANSGWKQYTVSLKSTRTVYSLSTLVKTNWSERNLYVDDIEIYTAANPWATYQAPAPAVVVSEMNSLYTAENSAIAFYDDKTGVMTSGESSLPIQYEIADDRTVTCKSLDDGASLTYVGKLASDLSAIEYVSATGTYAALGEGVSLAFSKYILDDFEVEGDREAFNATHIVQYKSGSDWATPSATDYYTQISDTKNSGLHSAKIKVWKDGQYRYKKLLAKPFEGVSHISFAYLNTTEVSIKYSVYAYTNAGATANQNPAWGYTMSANEAFQTVTLDLTKGTFYGYSIVFEANSGGSNIYPILDSVYMW